MVTLELRIPDSAVCGLSKAIPKVHKSAMSGPPGVFFSLHMKSILSDLGERGIRLLEQAGP